MGWLNEGGPFVAMMLPRRMGEVKRLASEVDNMKRAETEMHDRAVHNKGSAEGGVNGAGMMISRRPLYQVIAVVGSMTANENAMPRQHGRRRAAVQARR